MLKVGGLKRKVLVLRAVIYCWMTRLMGGGGYGVNAGLAGVPHQSRLTVAVPPIRRPQRRVTVGE